MYRRPARGVKPADVSRTCVILSRERRISLRTEILRVIAVVRHAATPDDADAPELKRAVD